MTRVLRYMRLADLPQVLEIDRRAFPTPWSERAYTHEVSLFAYSHMLVLAEEPSSPPTGWARLWRSLNPDVPLVMGYGGLWFLGGKAHISTLAVRPELRGQRFGALLLAALVVRGLGLGADEATLEVRVSNTHAQQLYAQFGFVRRGLKPGYYADTGEDAYDMALPLRRDGRGPALRALLGTLRAETGVVEDRYSAGRPPDEPREATPPTAHDSDFFA